MELQVKVFRGIEEKKHRDILQNFRYVSFRLEPGISYEKIWKMCAVHCRIPPACIHAFGIWDATNKLWMNLNDPVLNEGLDKRELQLEFRIRVRFSYYQNQQRASATALGNPFSSSTDFMKYQYRQTREDFLHDRIDLDSTSAEENGYKKADIKQCIAVIDKICLARLSKFGYYSTLKKISLQDVISKSYMKKYRWKPRSSMKVQNIFRKLLNSSSNSLQEPTSAIQAYMNLIERHSTSYFSENYDLIGDGIISVNPYQGVTVKDNRKEVSIKFKDITDIAIVENASCGVTLGLINGTYTDIAAKTPQESQQLASVIDACYRLSFNPHFYLCRQVCPQSWVDYLQAQYHGAISEIFAEKILKDFDVSDRPSCRPWLVRQSATSYDEYFLSVRNMTSTGAVAVEHLHLECTDGHLEKLKKLLFDPDIEQTSKWCVRPTDIVRPKRHSASNLSFTCSDEPNSDRITRNVVRKTISDSYNEVGFLGSGAFTMCKRYVWRDFAAVFKIIGKVQSEQQSAHARRNFEDSVNMMSCLDHQNIVQLLEVTAINCHGIWMEYVSHRSINTYLSTSQPLELEERELWYLTVMRQIAHALHYLEHRGFSHGNLSGHNILLKQSAQSGPHIKIADPGVTTSFVLDNTTQRSKIAPVLREPWLAPECLFFSDEVRRYPNIEADKWSFAVTICEIILSEAQFRDCKSSFNLAEKEPNEQFDYSEIFKSSLPAWITDDTRLSELLCKCWSPQPNQRPFFQEIVRALSSKVRRDYVFKPLQNLPDVVDEVRCYEDEKLTERTKLGSGHFGDVYLCDYVSDNTKVAVKSTKLVTLKTRVDLVRELKTMMSIKHPYIVQFLGVAEPSERLVMEFVNRGSLKVALAERSHKVPQLSQDLLQYSMQISEGMDFLQQKRIVHRDLALRNILISECSNGCFNIKISDFGLSRIACKRDDCSYAYVGQQEIIPTRWYAPECLAASDNTPFGYKSDVWSYGVTVWEIFSYGQNPKYQCGDSCSEVLKHLESGKRLQIPTRCPLTIRSILSRCWAWETEDRPTFSSIRIDIENLINNYHHTDGSNSA